MYFKRRIREDFAVMICGGGLLKFIPDSFLLYAQLLIPIKDSWITQPLITGLHLELLEEIKI